MCTVENKRVFGFESDKIVDIKESSVIDKINRHTPIGQTICLFFKKVVNPVAGEWVVYLALEIIEIFLNETLNCGVSPA